MGHGEDCLLAQFSDRAYSAEVHGESGCTVLQVCPFAESGHYLHCRLEQESRRSSRRLRHITLTFCEEGQPSLPVSVQLCLVQKVAAEFLKDMVKGCRSRGRGIRGSIMNNVFQCLLGSLLIYSFMPFIISSRSGPVRHSSSSLIILPACITIALAVLVISTSLLSRR